MKIYDMLLTLEKALSIAEQVNESRAIELTEKYLKDMQEIIGDIKDVKLNKKPCKKANPKRAAARPRDAQGHFLKTKKATKTARKRNEKPKDAKPKAKAKTYKVKATVRRVNAKFDDLKKLFEEYHEGRLEFDETPESKHELGRMVRIGKVVKIEYVPDSEKDVVYWHKFNRPPVLATDGKDAFLAGVNFTRRGFEA